MLQQNKHQKMLRGAHTLRGLPGEKKEEMETHFLHGGAEVVGTVVATQIVEIANGLVGWAQVVP